MHQKNNLILGVWLADPLEVICFLVKTSQVTVSRIFDLWLFRNQKPIFSLLLLLFFFLLNAIFWSHSSSEKVPFSDQHSSVLAWRIPGTGELPSLGLHRVGHDWSDLAAVHKWMSFVIDLHTKIWMESSARTSLLVHNSHAHAGTWVLFPIWQDSTCRGTTNFMRHN